MNPISKSLLLFVLLWLSLMMQMAVHAEPQSAQIPDTANDAAGSAEAESRSGPEPSGELGSNPEEQVSDQTPNESDESESLEAAQNSNSVSVNAMTDDQIESIKDKESIIAEMKQTVVEESELNEQASAQPVVRQTGQLEARVDLDTQEMKVYLDGQRLYTWKVSTGTGRYPTPNGDYTPHWLSRMHYSGEYENAPMPYAVFFQGGYAVHATQAVSRLGKPASHGCVRLNLENAKTFFNLVKENGKPNTMINIVGLGPYDSYADTLDDWETESYGRNLWLTSPSYPKTKTRTTPRNDSWKPAFVH